MLSWIPVSTPLTPYLLGQGGSPETGDGRVEVELTDLSLSAGQSCYAVVRSINGAGLYSSSASEAFIVDSSAPVDTTLSAPGSWSDRDTLSVQLGARDSESGIVSYRFALWEIGSVSTADEPSGEAQFIPVGGFVTGGQFSGTLNITGEMVTQDSYPGIIPEGSGSSEGSTGGAVPGLGMEAENFDLPPWTGDLEMNLPPFFESEWNPVSTGAPPESVDLEITIRGFPRLRYNRLYRLKVWVKNGAGRTAEAGSVTIQLLRPRQLRGRDGTRLPEGRLPEAETQTPKSGTLRLGL